MLHQTPTTSSFVHSSSSIPPLAAAGFLQAPPPVSPTYFRFSQLEREETKMDGVEAAALKKGCRPEAVSVAHLQKGVLPDDALWLADSGNLLGEDFLVDDLLDFDVSEGGKEEEQEEEAKAEVFDAENSNSSNLSFEPSSALSFEPPPPSDIMLPAHDAAEELEWVSRIIDDSLTEFPPCPGVPPHRPAAAQNQTQTKAHHENRPEEPWAGSPPPPKAICSLSTEAVVPVKAKRSKRVRTTGGAWPTFSAATLTDSSASTTTTTTTTSSSSSCSSSSSYYSGLISNNAAFLFDRSPPPLPPPPKTYKPKKRGRKPKQPPLPGGGGGATGERRCTHCGTQKTPQWRAGPLGSKTLCNACGVRFKSGRLLPEYRPACSPTFMSQVHSNSHRKVLEMRRKKEEQHLGPSALPVPIF